MSFAVRPPEVVSGQMYTGPGAEPMMTAALAWDALASELQSTAASYGSIVQALADESWTGPSAAAMTAAVAPYVAWMSATAAEAKAAADQARAAVAAYEAAFAAVVPPPEILDNRVQLATLLATNIFGQNTAGIAATEAQYSEMWAQDTAAMFGYATASAAATRLTAFTDPPPIADPAGLAGQAAAVGQASGPAAASAATATTGLAAASNAAAPFPLDLITQLLQALGDAATGYMKFWSDLLNTVTGTPLAGITWEQTFGIFADIGRFSLVANDGMSPVNLGMTEFKMFWKAPLEAIPKEALGAGLGMAPTGLTSAVSAGVGEANVVGKLSVPPAWASATPAIRMVSNALPATVMAAAPVAEVPASLINQMALGSMTGGAAGSVGAQLLDASGARARGNGGKGPAEPVKLDSVIAKLQNAPDSVQHWNVDKAGLDSLLEELSKKPGIHAVHVTSGDKPKVTLPTNGPAR